VKACGWHPTCLEAAGPAAGLSGEDCQSQACHAICTRCCVLPTHLALLAESICSSTCRPGRSWHKGCSGAAQMLFESRLRQRTEVLTGVSWLMYCPCAVCSWAHMRLCSRSCRASRAASGTYPGTSRRQAASPQPAQTARCACGIHRYAAVHGCCPLGG
jgi:hypothetical protein